MAELRPIPLEFDPQEVTAQRQGNYEESLLKQLLMVMAGDARGWAVIRNYKQEAGDKFGLGWFNDRFPDCPVYLGSRRLDEPFGFALLSTDRKFRSSQLWQAWREQEQSAPDRKVHALVFDCSRDGVAALVLHNWASAITSELKAGFRLTLVTGPDTDPDILTVQPWTTFAQLLAFRFNPTK